MQKPYSTLEDGTPQAVLFFGTKESKKRVVEFALDVIRSNFMRQLNNFPYPFNVKNLATYVVWGDSMPKLNGDIRDCLLPDYDPDKFYWRGKRNTASGAPTAPSTSPARCNRCSSRHRSRRSTTSGTSEAPAADDRIDEILDALCRLEVNAPTAPSAALIDEILHALRRSETKNNEILDALRRSEMRNNEILDALRHSRMSNSRLEVAVHRLKMAVQGRGAQLYQSNHTESQQWAQHHHHHQA